MDPGRDKASVAIKKKQKKNKTEIVSAKLLC